MKIAIQSFILLFTAITLQAQSSVSLQINHLLGGVPFENGINSTTDLGYEFNINRLQYYLSGFSITHDGGEVTEIEDLYALVSLRNSNVPTEIELGEYTFTTLESIKFHFGVDEAANHSDPSLYPTTHPLYPQLPSMHWGWTAGYRFMALEGKCGPNVDQNLELHCVGNQFYREIEFVVNLTGENNYIINIDAEYTNLLSSINVSNGLIIHGASDPIPTLSNNIANKLFTVVDDATDTKDSELVTSFEIYPNPVTNGYLTIRLDVATLHNTVQIHDALGKLILSQSQTDLNTITLDQSGLYFVSLTDARGNILAMRKVVVK